MREFKDYNGRIVKVGDTILRCKNGVFDEREVLGMTKEHLKLKRKYKWEMKNMYHKYDRATRTSTLVTTDLSNKPLYWHGWEKSFIVL